MLEELHISKYNSHELATLAQRCIPGIKQIAGEAYLTEVITLVEKDLSDVNRALGRDSKSSFTEAIKNKDLRRDRAYKNVRDFCESCVTDFDPAVEKAAVALDTIFEKHGKSLWHLGYAKQTGALKLLFDDLDTTEAAAHLAAIGATRKYAQLKKEQSEFEALYQDKAEGEGGKNIPLLSDSLSKLKTHFQHALDVVSTVGELRPDKVEKAAATLNEIIVDSRKVVLARHSREEKQPD